MRDFIMALPKAELHMHIEGAMQPELMFRLAERNGIELRFASVEALRDAYQFSNLQQFLDLYYEGTRVLLVEQDFYELTWDYLARAHGDRVVHAELFFDPQAHLQRGVAFEVVVSGICSAMADAQQQLGLSSKLILSFLRHLPAAEAMKLWRQVEPYHDRFVAVGLDSSELGHPPEPFQAVYQAARAGGLKAVAHAGEEGPPAYVWGALDVLGVDRIDHGNRALEDPRLVEELVRRQIPLTVCPLSNLRLAVVDDLRQHPLKQMLDLGLKVTVNSDDPAYFGGYISDNFVAVQQALDLQAEDLYRLARNSFESAFVDPSQQSLWISELDSYCARHRLQ